MKLEEELRRALNREPPAAGFADRVVARIESAKQRPPATPAATTRRRLIALATAAAIAVATGSTVYVDHRRRVSEAERVRNEAVVGLRIASAKLNDVHNRLLERFSTQNERPR